MTVFPIVTRDFHSEGEVGEVGGSLCPWERSGAAAQDLDGFSFVFFFVLVSWVREERFILSDIADLASRRVLAAQGFL